MRKNLNFDMVCGVFKKALKDKMLKNNIKVLDKDFELGFKYYISELMDFSKKTTIGLSPLETFIVRSFFGFNETLMAYNYTEIQKMCKNNKIQPIASRALFIIIKVIRDIRNILKKESERSENENIFLGDIDLTNKIFEIFQVRSIYTLGDLCQYTKKEILDLPGIDLKELEEVEDKLKFYNLKINENKISSNVDSEKVVSEEDRLKLDYLKNEYFKLAHQFEKIKQEMLKVKEEIDNITNKSIKKK